MFSKFFTVLILPIFLFVLPPTSYSQSSVPAAVFGTFEMISNGNGLINDVVGFDVTTAPTDHGAYSADWYRDALQGTGSIFSLPNGMQAAGGWYFVVAGPSSVTDFATAVGRWTRNGTRDALIRGNSYEIRFTAAGSKALYLFSSNALVDVPFELWYLASTPNDPSDDVRMIPVLFDGFLTNVPDVFDFVLDHQASGGNNDPYSDWIYFFMPVDDSPGQAGYNAFVLDPFGDTRGPEHLARVVLMNWNQHQGASVPFGGDGPVNAMPETGTTFRLSFNILVEVAIDIKPGSDPNSINCEKLQGSIPAAILTTEDFDATQVDPTTGRLLPGYATEVHGAGHLDDVDGDGDQDMLFHFSLAQTGISCGQTEATLIARTLDEEIAFGTDAINTVVTSDPTEECDLLTSDEHDFNKVRLLVSNDARIAGNDALDAHGFFPAKDCDQYIFAGGPWVGGMRPSLMNPIVSQAFFQTEFAPSEIGTTGQPFRVFNSSFTADVQNWPPEFSDGSGDPIIVHHAQNLVVQYKDGLPSTNLLGIEIRQRSLAYKQGPKRNAIIFIWEITNISGESVNNAYFGYFMDPDIGRFQDDRSSFVNDMAIAWDNDFSEIGFFSKNNENKPAIVGFDFLETPGDVGVANFVGWPAGGPVNDPPFGDDALQYDFLSGVVTYDNNVPRDQRILLSTGSFNLDAGASVVVAGALLFGLIPEGTTSLATDPTFPFRPDANDPVLADLLNTQNNVQDFYDRQLRESGLAKSGDGVAKTQLETIPKEFALYQNYPNPFNPVTTIKYSLPLKSQVDLVVYNTLGESVTQLVNEEQEAGKYSVEFNATNLPSGIYFYRLQAGSFVETKKMILLK